MTRVVRCILAFALVCVSLVDATDADASPACSTDATDGVVTKRVGGVSYELVVPEHIPHGMRVPLVLVLHGLGSNGKNAVKETGWVSFASVRPMIVAFPTAQSHTWAFTRRSPDVANTRRIVERISRDHCVNEHRVYAAGMSNGAFFAGRLACDAADVFAAVVAYAGGDPETAGNPCEPSEPIAVAQMHGTRDTIVPTSLGVKARDGWIRRSSCSTNPIVERVPFGPLAHYRWCDGPVEVMWRAYDGWKHAWPTGERGYDIVLRSWRFFLRYRNA